eukprot:g13659.t1
MKIATNLDQAQLRHDVVLAGGAAGPPGGNVNMGGMGAAASGAGASTSSGAAGAAASSLPGSFLHQHHQESLSAALEYSPAQLALYYIAWILVASLMAKPDVPYLPSGLFISLFASCFAFCAVVTVKRGVRAIFDPLRGSYTLEDYESEVVDHGLGGKAGASEFDRQQQLAFSSTAPSSVPICGKAEIEKSRAESPPQRTRRA